MKFKQQLLSYLLGFTSLLSVVVTNTNQSVIAQTIPDITLGAESSIINHGELKDIINGGATRGTNLFHSFQEFNIDIGKSVYFANPTGIENILTRVTGGNISHILGTLGVEGRANLFLINPNGIFFGNGAGLDIRGSFTATTADSIKLGENGLFSATNPQSSNLLTISPGALFFNQVANHNTRNIQVQESVLQVDEGKTLALVGGDISIDNANFIAPGGRVELGGTLGSGTVELNIKNNNFNLNFPDNLPRADIFLSNQSDVNVRAGGEGSIAVNARNFQMLGGSQLRAGIAANQGFVNSQAGNIEINTTGYISLDGGFILNTVRPRGVGNSGNIIIKTGSLSIINGSQLNTNTFGQGNSGNIAIQATGNISLAGEDSDGFSSAIVSNVGRTGVGKGGNIKIEGDSLSLSYGAEISASTSGRGDAGDITLQVRDLISLDGQTSNNFSSIIHSDVYDGIGNGGNVKITAQSLAISNQALVSASSGGLGNSGDININVKNLSLDGFFSAIVVGVGETSEGLPAIGNGGNINIIADAVSLTNEALIQLSTSGQGNVGALNLEAKTLSFTGGSEIQGGAFGSGSGGDINLNVSESINLSGFGVQGASSGVFSGTREGSQGHSGNITVNTGNLHITDGAVIGGRTRTSDRGGNITVNTNNLALLDGGQILTTAYSSGEAGNIIVTARDGIMITGSDRTFDARLAQFGRPIVDPVSSASGIAVNSQGSGAGGNLYLQAGTLSLDDQGFITAETASSNGGEITIETQDLLLLRNNSRITATAGTDDAGGNGGNININSPFIVALPNENSDITANAYQGNGGKINIRTNAIFGLKYQPKLTERSDITASSEFGVSGNVEITTPGVDPTSGLINLPTSLVDAESLNKNVCAVKDDKIAGGSSFIITGKGGLPADTHELISNSPAFVEWENNLDMLTQANSSPVKVIQKTINHYQKIQQAQGWMITPNGNVILTADTQNLTLQIDKNNLPDCK